MARPSISSSFTSSAPNVGGGCSIGAQYPGMRPAKLVPSGILDALSKPAQRHSQSRLEHEAWGGAGGEGASFPKAAMASCTATWWATHDTVRAPPRFTGACALFEEEDHQLSHQTVDTRCIQLISKTLGCLPRPTRFMRGRRHSECIAGHAGTTADGDRMVAQCLVSCNRQAHPCRVEVAFNCDVCRRA